MRVTVDLDEREYQRLEREAQRRGLAVSELARDLLRGGLTAEPTIGDRVHEGLEALAWLREFRKTLPAADIGFILEASRAELEERPHLWPKSSTPTP